LSDAAAWVRVLAAVGIYVVIALATARLVRRVGSDLKDIGSRTSPKVAVLGLVANLTIAGLVLLMLVLVDGMPVTTLGLDVDAVDLMVIAGAFGVGACVAGAFLLVLRRTGRVDVRRSTRVGRARGDVGGAMLTVAVLAAVAVQEEVLYRGYVTVNLVHLGWALVAVASIVLFVGIHLLTNRFTAAQVASWTGGTAVLILAYLISGSLWVAIAIHLGMDLLNVVAFDIVGQYSLVAIKPSLTDQNRALYRLASGTLIALLLLSTYGAHVATPVSSSAPQGTVPCHRCTPSL